MNEPQSNGIKFLTEVAAERSFERRFAGGPWVRLRIARAFGQKSIEGQVMVWRTTPGQRQTE